MRDMIKELFNGGVNPSELYLKEHSPYKTALAKIVKLTETLDREANHELMDSLRSSVMEAEAQISYTYFAVGFRWGARMMLSILSEGDTALNTEEDSNHD